MALIAGLLHTLVEEATTSLVLDQGGNDVFSVVETARQSLDELCPTHLCQRQQETVSPLDILSLSSRQRPCVLQHHPPYVCMCIVGGGAHVCGCQRKASRLISQVPSTFHMRQDLP